MPLSKKVEELRSRSGESLQELADVVGFSKVHIWALEKGTVKNPRLDLLKKLAEHFKVSVEFLSDDEAAVNPAAEQFVREFGGRLSTGDWDALRAVAARMSNNT